MQKFLFVIVFFTLNLGYSVYADLLIKPSFGISYMGHSNDYSNEQADLQGANDPLSNPRPTARNLIGNLGVYFQFNAGLFVGATFDANFINLSNYTHVRTTGVGLTAGYMNNGWFGSATYLFFISGNMRREYRGERRLIAGNMQNLDFNLGSGMGAIVQLGYIKFFSSIVGLGPSLQIRSFLFNDVQCGAGVGASTCGTEGAEYMYRRYYYRTFDVAVLVDILFKI